MNELELDKLTNDALQSIFTTMRKLEEPTTMAQQYAVALECQDILKKLYKKGYNTGLGSKMVQTVSGEIKWSDRAKYYFLTDDEFSELVKKSEL